MSRITLNSKCRLCRAEGQKLYIKGIRCDGARCPIEKKGAVKPGMHGVKGSRRKPSDYSFQLRAKQKAKRIFGVQERQFKNYYLAAKKLKGLVGDNLNILLERRLDNVLILAGLCLSRSAAKQLISHRHVSLNGRKHSISSYLVCPGDIVTLDLKGTDLPISDKDHKTPAWLQSDKNNFAVKVINLPTKEDINNGIDVNLIIEYYSR